MLTVSPRSLVIDRLWNGEPAWPSERSEVAFSVTAEGLAVEVTASFHGDPPPATAAGRTDALWEHEVIELFLANAAGHYLELEFGPHGHSLALLFSGIRQLRRDDIPILFQAQIIGSNWHGTAQIETSYLPAHLSLANAYAIHGQGQHRRYLAAFAVPGPQPDFHQPHFFQTLTSSMTSATVPFDSAQGTVAGESLPERSRRGVAERGPVADKNKLAN
jgi:hypothetical protein